jgi:hypothetical protein
MTRDEKDLSQPVNQDDALEQVWQQHRDALESIQPKNWKALSEIPREWPVVTRQQASNLIPPAERAHTGTPLSFLRWCGHQTIHPRHGRCDGLYEG